MKVGLFLFWSTYQAGEQTHVTFFENKAWECWEQGLRVDESTTLHKNVTLPLKNHSTNIWEDDHIPAGQHTGVYKYQCRLELQRPHVYLSLPVLLSVRWKGHLLRRITALCGWSLHHRAATQITSVNMSPLRWDLISSCISHSVWGVGELWSDRLLTSLY